MYEELGEDRYRPAPLLRKMVLAGWTGRVAGRGFYSY
jgi:3-hydroxybutyryl-CoA dehydrogenase